MEQLEKLSERILSLLIYEEQFETIINELRDEKAAYVADELKMLIVKDYIRPCRDIVNDVRSGFLYDSDQLDNYSFTLTGKGLAYLEHVNRNNQN
ncbi:MAG: hypothetical protein JNM67_12230 [Bacteroidetes bacterium]|nr:hypothetical protein [Bacteroidota bacterium]